MVLGLSGDKNKEGIAKVLRPVAQEIILTKANHPRAAVLNKEEGQIFPGETYYVLRKRSPSHAAGKAYS